MSLAPLNWYEARAGGASLVSWGTGTPPNGAPFTPTVGNKLVFACDKRANIVTTDPDTAGWTRRDNFTNGVSGTGSGAAWFTKVSDGTETGIPWPSGNLPTNWIVWELPAAADFSTIVMANSNTGAAGPAWTAGAVTPAAGAPAFIGGFLSGGNDFAAMSWTPGGGWTEYADLPATPNAPGATAVGQTVAAATGSYNPASTCSDSRVWIGFAFAISGSVAPPDPGQVFEVFDPADISIGVLDDATKKSIRKDLNGTGVGQFQINRYSAEATPAILRGGNYVKVTIPRIDPAPIFGFFLEDSGIKLVSTDEQGGENIQITGRGGLAYLERAIWLASSFVVNWWPATMATPPAGTKGAVIVAAGTYRHYTIAGGVITGFANFTTGGFSAYFDGRRTYDWPSAGSKRFLVHLTTTEDPASPSYVGYYFHPHQDGVTEYLPSYALNTTIDLTAISPDKPGAILYRLYQEAVSASRAIHPTPLLTVDFTATTDSDGNAWTTTDALVGVTAELGETYLTTLGKLLGTGVLDVEMGPDLVLHAYNHLGRDLTGPAFGAGVVRFVKGVNIADELSRELNPAPVATWTEIIGTDDVVAHAELAAVTPARIPRETSVRGETNDETALAALGLAELERQLTASDAIGFRVTAVDDDPSTGKYLPGPPGSAHGAYWPGDLVRLHTGTGDQDFNEADERVAAVTIAEDDAQNLEVTPELGSALGGGNGLIASAGSRGSAVVASTIVTSTTSSDPGVTDHGNLDGLADDDHPQYTTDAEVAAIIAAKVGAASPFSLRYTFSTTTTDADPGAGILRLSNAAQYLAVTVRADLADVEGADVTALLDLMTTGYLRLQKRDDPTKWLVASVSAVASPTGYRNVTIANIAKSANSPFADGDLITLSFVPTSAGGGGSGTMTTVKDEGTNLSTAVASIDFVGAGVTATGTTAVTVAIPGGGGSAYGDGKPYLETPPSPATQDDEFADATSQSGPTNGLDAKWSKHNLATAAWLVLDSAKAPGQLLFDIPTGQAADQSIYQAVPSGDFVWAVRMTSYFTSNRQQFGVFIVDSAGTGAAVIGDVGDPSWYIREAVTWLLNVNVTTVNGSGANMGLVFASGVPVTLAIKRASGLFSGAATFGDRMYPVSLNFTSRTFSAFTAAYIGFGRMDGTGSCKVGVEWIRKS